MPDGLLERAGEGARRVAAAGRHLLGRLYGRRRIRFTAGGVVFTLGTFAVGFAAINTGNNLLHLLLGAMLGLVGVSGWLSEQTLRSVEVHRTTPRGTPVGLEVGIRYRVTNRKRHMPSLAVEVAEAGLTEPAFVARLDAGHTIEVASANRFVERGVYPLSFVTLSTTFPFGLFVKERDIPLPGELVIWPRADRAVRRPETAGGHRQRRGSVPVGPAGARGEYRGLREYRPGDDPRDIHWRSSARLETPVVREYERDASETFWICLDLAAAPGERAEEAVEIAASLAARAAAESRRFGLTAGREVLPPGVGPAHLEAALDLLARADFDRTAAPPSPPADPTSCVLVSAWNPARGPFGDVYGPNTTTGPIP